MKNAKISTVILSLFSFLIVFILPSCEDFLDKEPKDALLPNQFYRDVNDADVAIRGIYGKLSSLGPQYVILNELRADLMDVTYNADYYLRQINLHEADTTNPYIDPKPFFSLINDCNDALKNFKIMLDDLKLSENDFNSRYSDIGALRSWLYLQLAIHFGEIPYITEPVEDIDDIGKIKDETIYPRLTLEEIIDELVIFMETLPEYDPYQDADLLRSIDGFQTYGMYINKRFVLGDLYLWNGDYLKAGEVYRDILSRSGETAYDEFKIGGTNAATIRAGGVDRYNSGYTRYYNYDENSAISSWPDMFSDINTGDADYVLEWIWTLFYDDEYPPQNPFLEYFSNEVGNYYFKPSPNAVSNWESQTQQNEFSGDFRGEDGSYYIINNEPVITKHISTYSELDPFNKSGKWGIYRAAGLHLRYSEAANRATHSKLAYALINHGIRAAYAAPSGTEDLTDYERTLLDPPFDIDARMTGPGDYPPNLRGEFHRNVGIRGRVYLQAAEPDTTINEIIATENIIIEEAALELAFEGNRWGDLLRIAMRRNDPSFLADKVYEKLNSAGYAEAEAVRQKLSQGDWFLPL